MFFIKNKHIIQVTRDSIGMADDVLAPHLIKKSFNPNQTLLSFCKSLKKYVFNYENGVWIIKANGNIIGYIYYNKIGICKIELVVENIKMSEKFFDEIHCSFIDKNYFIKAKNGSSYILSDPTTYYIEYPECNTLIDKVRKHFGTQN